MTQGPLSGINVLEFSVVVAGPATGMHLSDMGASVVKVEPPGGEPFRNLGAAIPGQGKIFNWLNHGKRSAVIDVRTPQGLEAIHRMMPNIDVFVINFRPGVAKRLGIDYETLSAIRPDLVYVDLTGFGTKGPWASRGASDIVAQAYGGAVAVNGKLDGFGAPMPAGVAVGDLPTGMAGAMAALAGIVHRERTGEGQLVSGSLLRSVLNITGISNMLEPASDGVMVDPIVEETERVRAAGGSYDDIVAARDELQRQGQGMNLWYGGYRAMDGGLILGALTPANRDQFRRILGVEGDRFDEPGFDPLDPANAEKAEELQAQIREILLTKTVEEWLDVFEEAGVPVSPVNYPEQVANDPQAGLMFVDVEHEVVGMQRQVGPLFEMEKTPTAIHGPAPGIGQHTADVLGELGGYSAEEIAALEAQSVIA